MAELVVFPDAVAIACTYLTDELAGTAATSRVPFTRPDEFVTVRRVGGVRRNLVVDEATLAVEAWAATDEDAHDLAQRCRALLHALPGQSVNGSFVYRVDEVGGPASLPDPDSDQPRYTFTAALAARGEVEQAS